MELVNLLRGYLLRRSPPEDEEPLDEEPLAEEPLLRLRDEPLEDLVLGWLRLRLGELGLALGRGEDEDLLTARERLGAGRE